MQDSLADALSISCAIFFRENWLTVEPPNPGKSCWVLVRVEEVPFSPNQSPMKTGHSKKMC